ncbi:MAG: hypothetical protein ACPLPV_00150, partial [Methanomassiliicoccales archaeon]
MFSRVLPIFDFSIVVAKNLNAGFTTYRDAGLIIPSKSKSTPIQFNGSSATCPTNSAPGSSVSVRM